MTDDELIREGKRLRANLEANEGPDDQSTLYTFALWAIDCAERLASRLEERGREGAWRDISSAVEEDDAPKDGIPVLLWDATPHHPLGGRATVASYRAHAEQDVRHPGGEWSEWGPGRAAYAPHWQPLPNPPAPPEGASE